MKWTKHAEDALLKVPFFVRKRVKRRVEEEAARESANEVTLEHVLACKKRFLDNLEDEVTGYHIEACFGGSGCPNRAIEEDDMVQRLDDLLSGMGIKALLKEKVKGPLKMHHEFQVIISDCPNACSRPQIADIGLIGARRPLISNERCSGCGACIAICRESAISLADEVGGPLIDYCKCLSCGQCINVCPTGAIKVSNMGYRILLCGKLGRHPQFGTELEGIFSKDKTLRIVENCMKGYMLHNIAGERFGDVLNRIGHEEFLLSCFKENQRRMVF